jgi:plasmid stabilization system protein ParE
MKYLIRIENDAVIDIDEIIKWYENEQTGLGSSFNYYLNETFNTISNNPNTFQIIYKDARRTLLKKFPYAAYYYINESKNEVVVYTVIHQHRNQKIWKKKIRESK